MYHEEYAPPWRPLLVLVFPILPIFWTYRVTITETKLTFGYSHAYSEIERTDILSVETVDHVNGLADWGGWGIRYNLKWEMGYIAKNGSVVRMEVKQGDDNDDVVDGNNTKIYVFNCDEAARVCSILNGNEE